MSPRYFIILLLYLMLGWLGYVFWQDQQQADLLYDTEGMELSFRGNDWVDWEDTEEGVVARAVHPLYEAEPSGKQIQVGDKLRKIDYNEIYQVETVEEIVAAAQPGHVFIFQIERTDPASQTSQSLNLFITNGFRLSFSFNHNAFYWQLIVWLCGLGSLMSFLILLILFPILSSNLKEYRSLSLIILFSLLFFSLQFTRYLYLLIEHNLTNIRFEKVYLILYIGLMLLYILAYTYSKIRGRRWLWMIPSALFTLVFCWQIYDIIFLSERLMLFADKLEVYVLIFCLAHLLVAVLLVWTDGKKRELWQHIELGGVMLVLLFGLIVFGRKLMGQDFSVSYYEHMLMGVHLLLFFPLGNATFNQLRFGKVSVVLTQTIQYLIAFSLSIFLYLAVNLLYGYVLGGNPYRPLLEIITLVLLVMLVRTIYRNQGNRLQRYFVTPQQKRTEDIKAFIARIPQYASSEKLIDDAQHELQAYFQAERVDIWRNYVIGQQPSRMPSQLHEVLYEHLGEQGLVWSRSKQISPYRLPNELEEKALRSAYTLINPISVSEEQYGLLMLGRKRRGVYNLSDLELISQLIQQTQLTLNVLQLVDREKELLEKNFEANLTALRSQINPHFLFNTLNTISALVHDSPDLAEEAIEKLAFIFRYTLEKSGENFVTLENELRLVSTYLEIEKIRFGERIRIEIAVEESVKEVRLPAFVIQTLIENCIKHGIAKIIEKGLIVIDAYEEKDVMICKVYDNGPGIDPNRVTKGTGLNNVLARLENIYDINDPIVFENTGEGTLVTLRIPKNHG